MSDPQIESGWPVWRIAGASVIGGAHLKGDLPCQDASAWKTLSNGRAIFAIADGAGSAPHSDQGAQAAVEKAIEVGSAAVELRARDQAMDDDEWHEVMRAVTTAARDAVVACATDAGLSPRAFACTLIVVVLGDGKVVTAHVGDGAVIARRRDGSFDTVSPPEAGEYANEVNFLTSARYLDHLRITVSAGGIDAAFLITDGLQFSILNYPDWTPRPGFFTSLLGAIATCESIEAASDGIGDLLASEKVRTLTGDDVTLVVALDSPADSPGSPTP
jgi:hypothetical protein